MYITTLETAGIGPALHAMRNPMDSWDKSDSVGFFDDPVVGEMDKDLSIKLQKSGPEHCKQLRMVMVWADIYAPRYWWNEFDTYRAGVEKVSCSTMHRLMARHLTSEDFECDDKVSFGFQVGGQYINDQMNEYSDEATRDE